MPKWAILFGVLLIALGLYGWMGGSAAGEVNPPAAADAVEASPAKSGSITALIPAFVGLPLLALGLVGMNPVHRKHAMHAAAAIALVGGLASGARVAMKFGAWIGNDPGVNQRAMWFSSLMAVLCLAFVVLAVRSFVAARQNRENAEGA